MSLVVNGTNIKNVYANGVAQKNLYANGTRLWSKAVEFVGSVSGNDSVSLSGISIQSGDVIFAVTSDAWHTTPSTPTPSGYTSLKYITGSSAETNTGTRLSYKIATGSETTVSAVSPICVMVFRNVNTASIMSSSSTVGGHIYTSHINPSSVSVSESGSMVIACGGAYTGGTSGTYSGGDMDGLISSWRANSGYGNPCAMAYKQVDSGTLNPSSWTFSGGNVTYATHTAITAVIRPD